MNQLAAGLIRLLCDPTRQEELAGDLEELRTRRARRDGLSAARRSLWLDVASICVRQSRARAWTTRQWVVGGFLLATLAAGTLGARDQFPRGPYTISARDAGGSFTLRFDRGRLLEARLNELPFPADRIQRSGSSLVLLGAGAPVGGSPGNLVIRVTSEGGISWEARPAPQSKPAPIDLTLAHEYVAELATVSAREAGRLWGRPLFGPLLLVDPATRFVVATQSDSAGILNPNEGLFTGTWPPEKPIANTALNWGGTRWTMIVWPLPGDRYARQRLAFHEFFHRLQPELGLEGSDPPNEHLATRDGRIWTRLEWRALAEALLRDGEARKAAVEDALVFRARRRAVFPQAAAGERALELNEGMAEYTGLKLSGLPERVLADRAAMELARREQQENLSRSFAYASGPAYAILLDERDRRGSWRRRLGAESDLSELVRAGYRITLAPGDAERRGLRYGGRRIVAEEDATAQRVAAAQARLRPRLVDGATLSLPIASRFNYSFDPNRVTPLPGIGTVIESSRVSDEWGILTVESGGVLLVRQGAEITRVVVPAPQDPDSRPLLGDGWRLELAAGWVITPGSRPGSWEVHRQR